MTQRECIPLLESELSLLGIAYDRSELLACWFRPSPPRLTSVAHDETAIDVDGLARHVIGVTAG